MLDRLGFRRPTYAELLAEQERKAKELFGDDIDTSEVTILGKYIRLNVYDYAKLYELAELIYYARFPNYATGHSLDRLLTFANITRNPATPARHIVEFYGTAGREIPVGTLVTTEHNVNFYTMESVVMADDGSGVGSAQTVVECTELGTIGNVEVGTIDRLVNPNAFVQRVTHISLELIAKDTETDVALRKRIKDTMKGSGTGTYEAIYGALTRLAYVDGVVIAENETHDFDKDGRPPHSFQCYIVAPESMDRTIAETIFAKKPVGIKCLGEVEVEVLDKGGFPHIMRFSRAMELPISIDVKIKVGIMFGENGVEDIKTNLMNFINGHRNGEDVILSKLYSYIHMVEGVEETSSLKISAKDGEFAAENIPVSAIEYARVTKERITIEVTDYVDLN